LFNGSKKRNVFIIKIQEFLLVADHSSIGSSFECETMFFTVHIYKTKIHRVYA